MFVNVLEKHYDVVVAGSGFGALFMVEAFKKRFPRSKIAIIERGNYRDHQWQMNNKKNSSIDIETAHRTRQGEKPWNYTIGFGGGLNCWWAQTPRFLPSDFKTKSLFGRGVDWPISYDDLEQSYLYVEDRMNIAGDALMSAVLPRTQSFPLPAHRLSTIDERMIKAYPGLHVPIATARASRPTDTRGQCCSSARCNLCPVDAKFSVHNGFHDLIADPDIHILTGSEVRSVVLQGGVASGLHFTIGGAVMEVSGDLVVIGANGIHTPAILFRSSINDKWVGRGLHESHSIQFEAYLDGLDNFDGGTVTTSLNYAYCDGDFRKEYAGSLIYFENRWSFGLRPERGKWKQTLPLWISVEDLPSYDNRVVLGNDDEPLIEHKSVSDYALLGSEKISLALPKLLSSLPIEKIIDRGVADTASHIQGSVRMGNSLEDSVVDRKLLHHSIRNLMLVGSGAIPTSSCANPSLTAAALSVYATNLL